MQRSHLVLGIMLATSLVATGCAGKMRMQMSMSCQAHGGTYDAATKSCMVGGTPRSSESICRAMGGNYERAADICEVGGG
jgi:hypothetical protein